jgi:pyruvate/2-oxoglutarate dehydrogenase complex dihydrolipoamide acyltransferase (E2) component
MCLVSSLSYLSLFPPSPAALSFFFSRLRAAGFLGGLIIAVTYLIRLHLGSPTSKTTSNLNLKCPSGKVIYRFPVELGRLAVFLESKISEKEIEMTFTHCVVKAVALTIQEIPSLNGHMIMNEFYLSKSPRVDLSLSIDINESQTITYKIEDADIKPLEYLADELLTKSQQLRNKDIAGLDSSDLTTFVKKLKDILPTFLFNSLHQFIYRFSVRYGIAIPLFGIKRFPHGICTIVSSPSVDGESDMDLAYIPDSLDTSAPIAVTMGGVRILPSVDSERKVSGTPVLNFAVSVNTKAVSMHEGRQFCSRLQQLLNEPGLIEKIHSKLVFDREEAMKRKQYFGTTNK